MNSITSATRAPIQIRGGQMGFPTDLDVVSREADSFDLQGSHHGWGSEFHLKTGDHSLNVTGQSGGRTLRLQAEEEAGKLHVHGSQGGFPLDLEITQAGDALTAQGYAHGFPDQFTITRSGALIQVEGQQNGFPLNYQVTHQEDGSLTMRGSENGFGVGLTLSEPHQAGALLPQFSPLEKVALLHVLLG